MLVYTLYDYVVPLFFFNDTATTDIYTLSPHDALPLCNERNPYPYLPAHHGGNYKETAGDKPEEGGDDVKSSWPLWAGLHTCYNGRYRGRRSREVERISENRS